MRAVVDFVDSETGQSLVEFALSLVFLIILLAGIVDLGRALFTYMALRDAAQEGALYGSIHAISKELVLDDDAIINRVENNSNMLQDISNDPEAELDVQVIIYGTACTGNAINVIVSYYNFPITMPFLGTILGKQEVKISASVTDTILSPACE